MAKFIGNRCIPTPEGKWDKTKEYLGLSVVLDEKTGDSYTSKKVVPAGTELTNKDYWALSGQYNAQMALIKQQLNAMQNIPEGGTTADAALENIRIGSDGTEYATPGDAVRGQVGALSEEIDGYISDIFIPHIQMLRDKNKRIDYCYYNSYNDLRYLPNSNVKAYAPIRIVEGKTYYYKNLYAYFCWIVYSDATFEKFDAENTSIALSGSFIAKKSGKVYITVSKSINGLYTDSKELYDDDIYFSRYYPDKLIMPIVDDTLKISGANAESKTVGNRFNELYENMIKFCNDGNYSGQVFNGAYIENQSLIIPEGYSGRDSYIKVGFETKQFNIQINALIPFLFKVNFHGLDNENNLSIQANNGAGKWIKDKKIIKEYEDGSVLYYGHIIFKENSNIQIYIQNLSSEINSKQIEIEISEAYLLLNNYNKLIYNKLFGEKPDHILTTTTVLTVGIGKQYTSLRKALEVCASNATKTNKYIVEYYSDGNEYDVKNDLIDEELTAESSYIGLTVPSWTKLIGINHHSKNRIVLRIDKILEESIRRRISTLNMKGNGEIENLTVIGNACRYAVHDDFGSTNIDLENEDVVKTVRNCHIISEGTYYSRAYGAGYRSGMKWFFEDCIFENDITDGALAPFSAHNNTNFKKTAAIIFKNCIFINPVDGGWCAMFGSLNKNAFYKEDIINTIHFYGCKSNGKKVRCYEERASVYGAGIKVAITGSGNDFTTSDIEISNSDGENYSSLITLW